MRHGDIKTVGDLTVVGSISAGTIYGDGSNMSGLTVDYTATTTNDWYNSSVPTGLQTATDNLAGEAYNNRLQSTIGMSTGVRSGGLVSVGGINSGSVPISGGYTTFNISSGTGYVVDTETTDTGDTDNKVPEITEVTWTAKTSQALPDIATTDASYIGINSAGGVVISPTEFTADQRRAYIYLGKISHRGISVVSNVRNFNMYADEPFSKLTDLNRAIGTLNLTGNEYVAASTDLTIKKTAGSSYRFMVESFDDRNDPSTTADAEIDPVTFTYCYRDAGGEVNFVSGNTNINPNSWDNGTGTLSTTISNNNYTIQRVFFFPSSNTSYIFYGQQVYTSLATARDGVNTEPFTFTDTNNFFNGASFRGWIIVQEGTTNLSLAVNEFISAGKFSGSGAGGGSATTPTYENAVTVSKTGGQYATIQSAIDSITTATADNRFAVLVYPGNYIENVVSKDFVSIVGIGTLEGGAYIKGTSGTLLTLTGESHVDSMNFLLEPTVSGATCVGILSGGNEQQILNNNFEIISSTDNINASVLQSYATGDVSFKNNDVDYVMTGTGTIPQDHDIFYINTGTIFSLESCDIKINVDARYDTIHCVHDITETDSEEIRVSNNHVHVRANSIPYDGSATLYYSSATSTTDTREINGNVFDIQAISGNGGIGNGYCYNLRNNSTLKTLANRVEVRNFNQNFYGFVGENELLISHFDDVVTSEGISGSGTTKYVYSPNDGQLEVSDRIILGGTVTDFAKMRIVAGLPNDGFINKPALELRHENHGTEEILTIDGDISTNTESGKALALRERDNAKAKGIFYTDGSYGLGAGGTSDRDVFLFRDSANTIGIGHNQFSPSISGGGNLKVYGDLEATGGVFGLGDVTFSNEISGGSPVSSGDYLKITTPVGIRWLPLYQ